MFIARNTSLYRIGTLAGYIEPDIFDKIFDQFVRSFWISAIWSVLLFRITLDVITGPDYRDNIYEYYVVKKINFGQTPNISPGFIVFLFFFFIKNVSDVIALITKFVYFLY